MLVVLMQMLGLWHGVYYWSSATEFWQSVSTRIQRNEEMGDIALFAAGAVYVVHVVHKI